MNHRAFAVRSRVALLISFRIAIGGSANGAGSNAVAVDEEDLKQLVVMVDATLAGEPVYGAGIIFGAGTDSLYVATANHVVRAGEIEAQAIRLRFRWRPDQPVQASLVRQRDSNLDLAVLRVVGLKASGIRVDALPFERVRDPSSLRRGDGLYLLGYPLTKAWRMNTTPEKFAEKDGDLVEFESNFVAHGHSGGALLDEQHNLVGMLKSDTPPYGQAASITKIAYRLRQWGYPVRLGIATIPDTLSSLSAGLTHVCGLTPTGSAYCWGAIGTDDTQGDRFGDRGSTTFSAIPVRVRGGVAFQSVSAGAYHTCGVTREGRAYCWGANGNDQLGSGQGESSEVPVPVAGNISFRMISAGGLSTCGVTTGDSATCWGFDLGDRPTPVAGSVMFESVARLGNNSIGITKSGEVFGWGRMTYARIPVRAPGNIRLYSLGKKCGLTRSGEAYCLGRGFEPSEERDTMLRVPGGLTFQMISDDGESACGVTTPGDVYCWRFPETSYGERTTKVDFVPKRASAGIPFASVGNGHKYTCGVTQEGGVYCWGMLANVFENFNGGANYGPTPVSVLHDVYWESLQSIEAARLEGDFKSAATQAEAALKRYPTDRALRREHALVMMDVGRSAAAITEIRALLPSGTKDFDSYLVLARGYRQIRNVAEMAKALDSAETFAASEAEKEKVSFARAEAFAFMKRYDDAEREYRRILKHNPENAGALNDLGYLLADRNLRLEEAEALIKRALSSDPEDGRSMDSLGLVYERKGDFNQAEAYLQRAWLSAGASPDVSEHLGDVYLKRAKTQEAIARWEEALQLWGRSPAGDGDPAKVEGIKKKLDSARGNARK